MARFSTVEDFLDAITVPAQRQKIEELLHWVAGTWPELEPVIKWNQPMFLHHGTYIIGMSVFPKNIAIGPEAELMDRMRGDIEAAGYTTTQRLFRIGWDDPIDYALLTRIIETQLTEKATVSGLWRP
ncbi:iron chaperone [Gryllotalpicola reticulitermitis]|uniref:Iron chaperone n=1 Tax=Gryllotalpicola reticulitermitis TaxID=1184153 RepID=A0ABV8Q3D5_9MICO